MLLQRRVEVAKRKGEAVTNQLQSTEITRSSSKFYLHHSNRETDAKYDDTSNCLSVVLSDYNDTMAGLRVPKLHGVHLSD